MKTVVSTPPEQKPKLTYPYLAKYKNTKLIVLFTAEDEGVVVCIDETTSTRDIGEFSTEWDEDIFTPLPSGSSVTLIQD